MYLGVDYGREQIGLAISDGALAEPLMTIPNTGKIYSKIKHLCSEKKITFLVIGQPSRAMGDEVRVFTEKLTNETGLPFAMQEEHLTSKEATIKVSHKKSTQRKLIQHAAAAAIILQDYLNEEKPIPLA